MTAHISGADADILIGTQLVNANQITLDIEDGTKATSTRGVPDGYVRGQTKSKGELKVDTVNFKLILEEAKKAGSWQQMEPVDITVNGKTINQSINYTAYGCKLNLSNALDAAGDGEDKLEHSIPFVVTDPRFVEIDGVPYIDLDHVKRLNL